MKINSHNPNQTGPQAALATEKSAVRPPSFAAKAGSLEPSASASRSLSPGVQQALAVTPPSLELLAEFAPKLERPPLLEKAIDLDYLKTMIAEDVVSEAYDAALVTIENCGRYLDGVPLSELDTPPLLEGPVDLDFLNTVIREDVVSEAHDAALTVIENLEKVFAMAHQVEQSAFDCELEEAETGHLRNLGPVDDGLFPR